MNTLYTDSTGLYDAYLKAMNIAPEVMPMNVYFQRIFFEAHRMGVTAKSLTAVITERRKRIREGVRYPECLMLRNLIGDEEKVGDFMNEWGAIHALTRKVVVNAAKAAVLKATGRPEWFEKPEQAVGPDEQNAAKPVSWHLDQLRKSCG